MPDKITITELVGFTPAEKKFFHSEMKNTLTLAKSMKNTNDYKQMNADGKKQLDTAISSLTKISQHI